MATLRYLGPCFNIKTIFPGMEFILKRWNDHETCLFFIIVIPILLRKHNNQQQPHLFEMTAVTSQLQFSRMKDYLVLNRLNYKDTYDLPWSMAVLTHNVATMYLWNTRGLRQEGEHVMQHFHLATLYLYLVIRSWSRNDSQIRTSLLNK